MKNKQYHYEHLSVRFNDKSKPFRVDAADDVPFHEVRKAIEGAVLGEKLARLQSFYDEENYSIDIWAEGIRSCILIHDALHGMSYNYRNEKYADREEWVEIEGYYAPQKCICEDTHTLLDIIITFLETGKPCERYNWFETKE